MSVRDHEDVLVARLQELAPHLDGEPDPAFRAATRQRLVAMAAVRSPAPAPVSPFRRLMRLRADDTRSSSRRTRFTAGLAGAALTVTAAAALVAVAAGAGPGDPLYGVKRGTEQTQLALAGDTRGQTLLEFASTRLDELAALGGDAALAESTIATMDRQTTEGAAWLAERAVATGEGAPLDRLSSWAGQQSADLAALRDDVPPSAVDDVDGSLALLTEVTTRAEGLRGALGCPAGPSTAGSDPLGPVPALCLPEAPAPEAPAAPGGGQATTPPQTAASPVAPSAPAPAPAPSSPAPAPVPGGPNGAPGGGPATTPTPGGPLPSITVPRPGAPAPTTVPPPVLDVPLPLPLGVCVPGLLSLGTCPR